MEPRVQCHRLIHYLKIAIELLELATHGRELAGQGRGVAEVVLRSEQATERRFHQRGFGSAGTGGRFRQSRGHALGEIDANSGFHGNIPLQSK